MEFNKYQFREYNKDYPKLFEKEKRRLRKIFPQQLKDWGEKEL